MHPHLSFRERLEALGQHKEPVFEPSNDPTLVAFAKLFAESGLVTFEANKHLRTGALTPLYDCWTESRAHAGQEPERFIVIWDPVWANADPVTGFRVGRDSTEYGSTPTVAMPPDEHTGALLLLVTSTFVHLSGNLADHGAPPVVQGAVSARANRYRFVTLEPNLAAEVASPSAGGGQIEGERS